jgi:NAD-dependent dihydropyrimidine dehydrogenase PreA subunit
VLRVQERKIIEIDEERCNGCGLCVPNCAESAIQIIDGKAKLVKDSLCDGLGACIGHCPQGALRIIEREADAFSDEDVHAFQASLTPTSTASSHSTTTSDLPLGQWPVQLRLVPVKAPFLNDADLIVVADCVPIAYPALHRTLLPGKAIVIGCPKFDDVEAYADKLGAILEQNAIRSVTVAHMEVPCCSGLLWIVQKAVETSRKRIPVTRRVVTVKGALR